MTTQELADYCNDIIEHPTEENIIHFISLLPVSKPKQVLLHTNHWVDTPWGYQVLDMVLQGTPSLNKNKILTLLKVLGHDTSYFTKD